MYSKSSNVKSDLNYVKSMVNEINGLIKESRSFLDENHYINSYAAMNVIYDRLDSIMNYYCNVQGVILDKVSNLSDQVLVIAERYEDVDKNLKNHAQDLMN